MDLRRKLKDDAFWEDADMWEWLQGLSGGAATFIGSLTGSFVGLLALLIGAMFNAHLNRKRDDAIRRQEIRGLAAALHAELDGIRRGLEENTEDLKKGSADFVIPDVSQAIRVLPAMMSKLGLLDADTIQRVIDAHIVIEQYVMHLTMRGGVVSSQAPSRRLIGMKKERADVVALLNQGTAEIIQKALRSLEPYLR